MNYDEIYKAMKEKMSEKRFKHVLGVVETAKMLANLYDEDIEKAKIASILHDCAKEYTKEEMERLCTYYSYHGDDFISKEPALLHSKVGAILASATYGVSDEDVLNAISYHTTGRKDMTMLEKIIFIADYIEPSRSFEGVENIRKLAFRDIDLAVFEALENILLHLIEEKSFIHIDTLYARNDLLKKIKNRS
ncbi:MAG: bis(5'-nucleosyl)-tetraphosphatase (symmetrical) YqeK [Clostridiales bacterium]|nr:bis(5'-nucleosyl)-tetraphosphatase (symmetrical) YqeK [Clostridiales bacterium]